MVTDTMTAHFGLHFSRIQSLDNGKIVIGLESPHAFVSIHCASMDEALTLVRSMTDALINHAIAPASNA